MWVAYVLHKRQQHSINQVKKLMKSNNLTAIKADKSKTIVIINKDQLQMKVNEFIKDNIIFLLDLYLVIIYYYY